MATTCRSSPITLWKAVPPYADQPHAINYECNIPVAHIKAVVQKNPLLIRPDCGCVEGDEEENLAESTAAISACWQEEQALLLKQTKQHQARLFHEKLKQRVFERENARRIAQHTIARADAQAELNMEAKINRGMLSWNEKHGHLANASKILKASPPMGPRASVDIVMSPPQQARDDSNTGASPWQVAAARDGNSSSLTSNQPGGSPAAGTSRGGTSIKEAKQPPPFQAVLPPGERFDRSRSRGVALQVKRVRVVRNKEMLLERERVVEWCANRRANSPQRKPVVKKGEPREVASWDELVALNQRNPRLAEIQAAKARAEAEASARRAEEAAKAEAAKHAYRMMEKSRYNEALQRRLLSRIHEMNITLPPLCGCGHGISPLNEDYQRYCANNCPLRADDDAFAAALSSVLYTYGVVAPS